MAREASPEAGSLAAYIMRESAEELQYAMDKGRVSSTPSAAGDFSRDEPRPRASPSAATADGESVRRSCSGSAALPFADAGLRGAGAIFLTKYGRGRAASDVGASKSPNKHSPGGGHFYVVRSPPDPRWPRAAPPLP